MEISRMPIVWLCILGLQWDGLRTCPGCTPYVSKVSISLSLQRLSIQEVIIIQSILLYFYNLLLNLMLDDKIKITQECVCSCQPTNACWRRLYTVRYVADWPWSTHRQGKMFRKNSNLFSCWKNMLELELMGCNQRACTYRWRDKSVYISNMYTNTHTQNKWLIYEAVVFNKFPKAVEDGVQRIVCMHIHVRMHADTDGCILLIRLTDRYYPSLS